MCVKFLEVISVIVYVIMCVYSIYTNIHQNRKLQNYFQTTTQYLLEFNAVFLYKIRWWLGHCRWMAAWKIAYGVKEKKLWKIFVTPGRCVVVGKVLRNRFTTIPVHLYIYIQWLLRHGRQRTTSNINVAQARPCRWGATTKTKNVSNMTRSSFLAKKMCTQKNKIVKPIIAFLLRFRNLKWTETS